MGLSFREEIISVRFCTSYFDIQLAICLHGRIETCFDCRQLCLIKLSNCNACTIVLTPRSFRVWISINNQVAVHCQCITGARIDLDYRPEFRGAICGQPNPVHLLFKQWQSIYWNVRADRNSNNCTYRTEHVCVRDRVRVCACVHVRILSR